MVRHNIRRPALILAVGLVVAFTTFFGSGTAPLTSSPVAPQTNDGPSVVTDSQGHFRFGSLHSASHVLRLDTQTLPSDIQPRSADLTLTLSPGVTQSLAVAPGLALRAPTTTTARCSMACCSAI